ncbi:carbohydrate esterase family 9 protein [Crassisporium funariophilum]|nr:carbohydrate esterase family 9 protein [Crassisporium funariophilum]
MVGKNPPHRIQGRWSSLYQPMYQLRILLGLGLLVLVCLSSQLTTTTTFYSKRPQRPLHASAIISRCRQLELQPGPTEKFHQRSHSDRYEEGTRPVLIKHAKLWTGRKNGTEVIYGDVLLDKGIIKSIGHLSDASLTRYGSKLVVLDVDGAWVTPGIVDIHSHLGDASSPALSGSEDDNSLKGTIQPWLRSLDGLNTHDDAYPLSIAGGVTTSLILPGSANAIGGQAFVIKLRETTERSPSSMLLEPPYHVNTSFPNPNLPPRWRHMKHACGENPSAVYKDTRMDTIWAFRQAYNTATQIKERQDEYCSRALSDDWADLGDFPEVLQWEALVDVVRGRVKVNIHCYEAVDLDGIVRLSNEFKFPIAAFHHASEAYLVPDLLKKTYGKTPAIALFATNSRYKREAYRASEFAPHILAQHGLTVLMKSDHPVMNSRYLLYEAQQAHYYGLAENLAIASVTSNSAEVMGMGHRIGYLQEGYDADLVVWDSHPLALGATPSQVFIDGIPQLESPHVVKKPDNFQRSPRVPNFGDDAQRAIMYEGLPPLAPKKAPLDGTVVFINVKSLYQKKEGTIAQVLVPQVTNGLSSVAVRNGSIVCYGQHEICAKEAMGFQTIDLEGGSISPGLVSFGSQLGLQHIEEEPSTNDGALFDPLRRPIPAILGGDSAIVRAVDGLQYGSRDALLAYRAGVTTAVTAPTHKGFYGGLATSFSLSASHRLEKGAIVQEITGVHMSVRHFSKPSISTQIAALRRLLLGPAKGSAGNWFKKVKSGEVPLVVEAHSADIIATLIILKKEVEHQTKNEIRLTITGATESHLLAKELGEANVGVILSPSRPFPYTWEDRRILPGPPITKNSAIVELINNNVVVGIGCEEIWSARNLPFDIAWAAIEAGGGLSKEEAFAIGSTNIEKLLGVRVEDDQTDLVATRGGDLLSYESRVVAVISPRLQSVHTFNA